MGYRVDLRFLSRVLSGFFDLERDHVIAGVAAEVRAGGRLVDWAGLGDGGVVLSAWSAKLVGRRLVAAVNRAGELVPAALNEGAGEVVRGLNWRWCCLGFWESLEVALWSDGGYTDVGACPLLGSCHPRNCIVL